MEQKNKKGNSFWFYLSVLFAISFPVILLFRTTARIGFYDDWYDNMYFVAYFGEYFKHHLAFPSIFNTNNFVGGIIPVVYGYVLYPFLGFFSSFLGANLTIRISILILFFWQFISIYILFNKITKEKYISFSIAVLVIWAIYPLTNIYNRGTLPEVYSNGLLTVAVALWFLIFIENEIKKKIIYGFQFTFSIVMSLGTWPPIIAQVIFIAVPIFIFSIIKIRNEFSRYKSSVVIVFASFVISLVILFPNLYAILKYKDVFSVTKEGLAYYSGIDNFFVRFSPFPLDLRALYLGLNIPEGTPYLDAQINMPLLIVTMYMLFIAIFKNKVFMKRLDLLFGVLLMICMSIYYSLMSLSPSFAANIPDIFKNMHFHYRYISYINISILLLLISITIAIYLNKKPYFNNINTTVLLTACLAVSFQSVIIKNIHGNSITDLCKYESAKELFGPQHNDKSKLLDFPGTAGHIFAYRNIVNYRSISANEERSVSKHFSFKVKNKDYFGNVNEDIVFVQDKSELIYFNMYPFEWNNIYVDEVNIKTKDLFIAQSGPHMLGVFYKIDPGKHIVKYVFKPEKTWEYSNNISQIVLFCLFFVTIIISMRVL